MKDQDQDQVSLQSDFLSVGSVVQHKSIHVSKKIPPLPQKVLCFFLFFFSIKQAAENIWDFFQRRTDPCSVGCDEVFLSFNKDSNLYFELSSFTLFTLNETSFILKFNFQIKTFFQTESNLDGS